MNARITFGTTAQLPGAPTTGTPPQPSATTPARPTASPAAKPATPAIPFPSRPAVSPVPGNLKPAANPANTPAPQTAEQSPISQSLKNKLPTAVSSRLPGKNPPAQSNSTPQPSSGLIGWIRDQSDLIRKNPKHAATIAGGIGLFLLLLRSRGANEEMISAKLPTTTFKQLKEQAKAIAPLLDKLKATGKPDAAKQKALGQFADRLTDTTRKLYGQVAAIDGIDGTLGMREAFEALHNELKALEETPQDFIKPGQFAEFHHRLTRAIDELGYKILGPTPEGAVQ